LKSLIAVAFNLSTWQISGGDAWTENDEYTIEAKPPMTSELSTFNTRDSLVGIEDEHLRQMLQALLIERFQLKFHREMRTGKVYILEKSGKALKLRPTEAPSSGQNPMATMGSIGWAGRWVLCNTSMAQLAKHASDFAFHCPVLDSTELTGSFDNKSPTETAAETHSNDYAESIIELFDEIGLKLKSAQGSVETFIVDGAEKPSPN
jgi:uncharacterized protein (TIGR03435 family)